MRVITRIGVAVLFVAVGSPFHTTAQPARQAAKPRVVPMLGVYAMPGFQQRAPAVGAGGGIPLDPEQSVAPFNAVTIESDSGGRCSHSAHMPATDISTIDERASATWRVEASPVKIDGDDATIDIRWSRRVTRPGVFFEQSIDREERLTLRDGARGILDVVRATGEAPGVCESFAIALEMRFASTADEPAAGLAFDLWLIDRKAPSTTPLRVRTQGRQGADVTYGFPPLTLMGSSGPVTFTASGVLTGRARRDGVIDLTVDAAQAVRIAHRVTSGSGRKRLLVRSGETIEFELPDAEQAKLPPELQEHHDFALRVTTDRLW
jgi:hypothetical protein